MSLRAVRIDVEAQRVVKLLPSVPPRRGERILIDGDIYRVTRAKVTWREPGVWEIRKLCAKKVGRKIGDDCGRLLRAWWIVRT